MAKLTRSGRSVTRRTLERYWEVTTIQGWTFLANVLVTLGYVFFLTFASPLVVGKVVDLVAAGGVGLDRVWEVFGPYVALFVGANVAGQVCSKLQDYTCARLEIRASYELARRSFDVLSNQSMTFHTNRYGGSLVSATQKYVGAYATLMDTFTYSLLPGAATVAMTIALLSPFVPAYVVLLAVVLVIYVMVVLKLYRKILPINAAASAAQNRLSGELSDSITNIMAVKTAGREAYEQEVFRRASEEVRQADSARMRRTVRTGAVTSTLIVLMMALTAVFIAGGNAWLGISGGTLVMMFTYTNTLAVRLNMLSAMFQQINRAIGDAHDLTVALDEPLLVADDPKAPKLRVTAGRIDFEGVGFRSADADEQDRVFDDFTLEIPAGQRVGLVGRSGSGKTTLTTLLLRLEDLTRGRILIDGQDIAHVTQTSQRRRGGARRPRGERLGVHRAAAGRPRHRGGRARREALRRAAPARRHRARHPHGRTHPRARRGHERARLRERAAHPGRVREPHARPHRHRGGPSSLDRGEPRPHRGALARRYRGGWHARGARGRRRRVREPLEPPDGLVPRERVRERHRGAGAAFK